MMPGLPSQIAGGAARAAWHKLGSAALASSPGMSEFDDLERWRRELGKGVHAQAARAAETLHMSLARQIEANQAAMRSAMNIWVQAGARDLAAVRRRRRTIGPPGDRCIGNTVGSKTAARGSLLVPRKRPSGVRVSKSTSAIRGQERALGRVVLRRPRPLLANALEGPRRDHERASAPPRRR